MPIKTILLAMRPPFLLLTVSCCLLAFSLASQAPTGMNESLMLPVFLVALFAHISVNSLNEYQDFTSGLDLKTQKTAFSGGSGALPEHPEAARAILISSLVALTLTAGLGLYLLLQLGAYLLIPGILGLVIIITYTRWINRLPWLCLIAPGLGFGLLMVTGSYVALVGGINSTIILLSLIPFFLVNNLLLLNQYPDIEADKAVGRNHFPIRYGVSLSNFMYLLFLLSANAVIVALILNQQLPALSWIALLPCLLGLLAFSGAMKYKAEIGEHPGFLAANVATALLTPFLLALSIYLG